MFDVVFECQHDEQGDHCKADVGDDLARAHGEWAAFDGFDAEDDEFAAIEEGDGEEVEDAEVDGDDGEHSEECVDAIFAGFGGHVADHDGAAEGFGGDFTLEHFGDVDDQHGGGFDGCRHGHGGGVDEAVAP